MNNKITLRQANLTIELFQVVRIMAIIIIIIRVFVVYSEEVDKQEHNMSELELEIIITFYVLY